MRRTLALIAVSVFAFTLQAATHDVIKRGYNVAEGGTLHLQAGVGDVKIVCGGTGVAIEIQRDADHESYLKRHTVTFSQSGNDVTVTGKYESAFRFFHFGDDLHVRYNIRVHEASTQSFQDYLAYRADGGGKDMGEALMGYAEGTLGLEIVDVASRRTAWRATATAVLDQDPKGKLIDPAVRQMMERFPASRN